MDGRELAAASRRDLLAVGVATLVFLAASIALELSETLLAWTRPWERYELDEIPGTLLALAVGLAWFAARRVREARAELRGRVATEQRLAEALAENRRLSLSHVNVQEEERRQLARELHDELGQHLNAIKVNAVAIRSRTAGSLDEVHDAAVAVIDVTDHVHATVRDMLRRLRPVGLDELGLAAALEHLVASWQARNPRTRAELRIAGAADNLHESENIAIYRLVQEALNNVTRHARASAVTIALDAGTDCDGSGIVTLSIADDGTGAPTSRPAAGLGLIGMRERVEALQGRFSVDTAEGTGFRITATLPRSATPEAS